MSNKTKETAKASVLKRLHSIDLMLIRLSRQSDRNFGLDDNFENKTLHWGHVGDLGQIEALLENITHIVFKEGEHAA